MKSACVVVALLLASGQNLPVTPTVRLHHLHVRTSDVSAALAEAVRLQGGSRVLLQGLGVGVRAADQYVLFDMKGALDDGAAAQKADRSLDVVHEHDVAGRYHSAVRWLTAHGVAVSPSDLTVPQLAAMIAGAPAGTLDHVAFAAASLDSVVVTLRAAGVTEVRQTEDSAFFIADGAVIEITRDTELPDALWCPMHPDVRSSSAAKCPICSMDLVPIPPPRIGQYRVDVTQVPAAGRPGTSTLSFRIRDPESGEPVTAFAPLHERLFHLFIVSRDLQFFAHEHPVQDGNRFYLPIDLAPGAYMLVADFLPAGGSPQMVHHAVVTPGYAAPLFSTAADLTEDLAEKFVDGMRVQLALDSKPGRLDAVLRFRFTDAKRGEPVGDLQPYLGASGHLLIVSADLTHAVHAHPEGVTSGPGIDFGAEFPTAGLYKLWVQVQRDGKVFTAPFVVRVGAS